MAGLIYYTDKRRVLPQLERTTTYKDTRNLINLNSEFKKFERLLPIINLKEENLSSKFEEWKKTKNYNLAGDILSQALMSKKVEEVNEIKKHLLSNHPTDSILNWLFGNKVNDITALQDRIKHNYKKLSLESKDALTWTDQAINFISIDREESIKCIEKAVEINGDMGFIVRNASRIFNLTGDTNRAIKVLKSSQYYKHDPQILSAEIAFSQLENRKTSGVELADRLITNSQYGDNEKTELASTLGTMEFFKENYKKSEKLFDLALMAPNKNSFAQSVWYKKEEIPPQKYKAYSHSNEIQAHKNSNENKFEQALEYALLWKNDEPYSLRPYKLASQISGVLLGDNSKAYDLVLEGLQSQKAIKGDKFTEKDEHEFNNDLAYHLLKCDRIDEAEKYLESSFEIQNKTTKLDHYENILVATIGLLAYKKNHPDKGRKLYRQTIKHFSEVKEFYLVSSAFLNFFDEEVKVLTDIAELENLRKELDDIVPKTSQNDLLFRKNNSIKLFDGAISKRRQTS